MHETNKYAAVCHDFLFINLQRKIMIAFYVLMMVLSQDKQYGIHYDNGEKASLDLNKEDWLIAADDKMPLPPKVVKCLMLGKCHFFDYQDSCSCSCCVVEVSKRVNLAMVCKSSDMYLNTWCCKVLILHEDTMHIAREVAGLLHLLLSSRFSRWQIAVLRSQSFLMLSPIKCQTKMMDSGCLAKNGPGGKSAY